MKIVYDISLLGLSHRTLVWRTGIFRVVENLACGLLMSNECSLTFSAIESSLVDCINYIKSHPQLEKVNLSHSKIKRIIESELYELTYQINNSPPLRSLLLRVLRKLFAYIYSSVNLSSSVIDKRTLSKADIFHSPYHAFPQAVKSTSSLIRFLTVYDLIPILYPKYFLNDNNHYLNQVLESVTSEDWVICISQSTKNDLCSYLKHIDPARVFVTHLAASELFYPCHNPQEIRVVQQKYGLPNSPYILSLSTLEPRKNIDHVIRSFLTLLKQEHIKDLYLVLVGTKGWDYSRIFQEIENNSSLKEKIILLGYVADEDLAALYSGALLFVYPSFYEGFGLPPLEAMQCGVPVITSNTSSLPEVVGDAGIMLDPQDQDGLCQSMLEIYTHPSLRESMSKKSLQQAANFSWTQCTRETIAAYKTSLG